VGSEEIPYESLPGGSNTVVKLTKKKPIGSDYQYTKDQYLNIYKVKVFCKKAMGSADPIAYTLLPHCSNNYMRPLPIRVMTEDHFEHWT
jgi:hypothetical protein